MRAGSRVVIAVALVALLFGIGASTAVAHTSATTGTRTVPAFVRNWSDFNGDGYDDLAIGAPYDDVAGRIGAGVVNVLYGSPRGLTATGTTVPTQVPHSQVWSQDSSDVADHAETGDHFGWALAKGDFDSDGYADLAIGVPGEDVGGIHDIGGVNILYGSGTGLVADSRQSLFTEKEPDSTMVNEHMGTALVALDYVQDGHAQLAVGIPGQGGTGAVWLVEGAFIDPDAGSGGISPEHFDSTAGCLTGSSLAVGHFDTDSREDLIVGEPGCDVPLGGGGTAVHAGKVAVLFNGPAGTVVTLHQDAGFFDVQETGDRLGSSVAAADVNGDGVEDLLAGAPGEDLGGKVDAGKVSVALRKHDRSDFELQPGIDYTRKRLGSANVAKARFGTSLASGHLGPDHTGFVVGARGDTVNGKAGAGSVWVVYRGNGDRSWTQDSGSVLDSAETGDAFGSDVATGDFDGDGSDDLAIGVPMEDVGSIKDAGAVNVLYSGADTKLNASGDDLWTQSSPSVPETAQAHDRFGFSVR